MKQHACLISTVQSARRRENGGGTAMYNINRTGNSVLPSSITTDELRVALLISYTKRTEQEIKEQIIKLIDFERLNKYNCMMYAMLAPLQQYKSKSSGCNFSVRVEAGDIDKEHAAEAIYETIVGSRVWMKLSSMPEFMRVKLHIECNDNNVEIAIYSSEEPDDKLFSIIEGMIMGSGNEKYTQCGKYQLYMSNMKRKDLSSRQLMRDELALAFNSRSGR